MFNNAVHQQDIAPNQGNYRALRACVPACFYITARACGYLPDVSLDQFCAGLDWERSRTSELGWLRPKLSTELRARYNMPIVTWRLDGKNNLEHLCAANYIATDREFDWYKSNASQYPVEGLVAAGVPIIVTVKPGFGANKFNHAVILATLKDDTFEIIDPDNRNKKRFYSLAEVRAGLELTGAASVILPTV